MKQINREGNEVTNTNPTTSKPLKPRKLTVKQAKFVKAKAEGMTGVAAAQKAYGVKDYWVANAIAHENIKKPSIQEALEAEYEKQGLTLAAIVKPIADGVVANRVVQVEGDFFETEVADMPTRIAAAKTAAMWLGIGKQTDTTTNLNFINISRSDKGEYGL